MEDGKGPGWGRQGDAYAPLPFDLTNLTDSEDNISQRSANHSLASLPRVWVFWLALFGYSLGAVNGTRPSGQSTTL